MFKGAYSFNQPLDWTVENVVSMQEMFKHATSFNQCLHWVIPQGCNDDGMFEGSPGRVLTIHRGRERRRPRFVGVNHAMR